MANATRRFVMTLKEAQESLKVSQGNSKMPGSTFAQDSFACNVGSRLASVKGSVCESCYARKIQKLRPSVNQGWKSNLEKARHWLQVNPTQWIKAATFQIEKLAAKSGERFHRWFDSGDLDSFEQLVAIVQVAESTPTIKHWLPTREIRIVKRYMDEIGDFPKNLVVRVSSPMIGDSPLTFPNTSTVHRKGESVHGMECRAYTQGNQCGDCRACWNPDVSNISYKKH